MALIHRVRVFRVLSNLSTEQVFAFRMAGDQEDARAFGHLLQTHWMQDNPGHATVLVIDWPTPTELGEVRVMPEAPNPVHWG